MWRILNRRFSIMVLAGIALHYIWALLIIINPVALGGTPTASVHSFFNTVYGADLQPVIISFILAISSISSSFALTVRAKVAPWFLLPQLFILMICATGSLSAAWLGEYADGVPRDSIFILADQMPVIIIAAGYFLAIISFALTAGQNGRE